MKHSGAKILLPAILVAAVALIAPAVKAGGPLLVLDGQPTLWARNEVRGGALNSMTVDAQGRVAMDFIGKSERAQQDYAQVCERLGFPAETLGKVNSSSHAPYTAYYDDELRQLVGDFYRRDLELFGYEFAGSVD